MDFPKVVLAKLDKIEEKQVEHTIQLALNTSVLDEHHRRSTNLETRIEPIEDHVKFLRKLLKLIIIVVPIVVSIVALVLKHSSQ